MRNTPQKLMPHGSSERYRRHYRRLWNCVEKASRPPLKKVLVQLFLMTLGIIPSGQPCQNPVALNA